MSTASRLALASASPYKRALLERLGLTFACFDPDIDESALHGEAPDALALRLARSKADAGRARLARTLGHRRRSSDRARRGALLETRHEGARARAQLAALSGRTHELLCAVAVAAPDARAPACAIARVSMRMRALTEAEIEAYVERDDPTGCAGSYKIEAAGVGLFVATRTDDPSAIEGLPLMRTRALLERTGYFDRGGFDPDGRGYGVGA